MIEPVNRFRVSCDGTGGGFGSQARQTNPPALGSNRFVVQMQPDIVSLTDYQRSALKLGPLHFLCQRFRSFAGY